MNNYQIMIETTNSKTLAQNRLNILNDNHITGHLETVKLANQMFYSVQAGPYTNKKMALETVDRIKKLGIKNAFITQNAITSSQ